VMAYVIDDKYTQDPLPGMEKMPEDRSITYPELVQALKSLRIWVRDHREDDYARRGYVLHPEDAAKDIFTSVKVSRQ
jgi:hypothetical protein